MTEADRKDFAVEMARLAEGYQSPLSMARITVYFEALDDYDLEDLTAVMRESIRRRKFFPKVVEIRHDVKAIIAERTRSGWVRTEQPKRSCFDGVPCEQCDIYECSCAGCAAVIAKCRVEFAALNAKIQARLVRL